MTPLRIGVHVPLVDFGAGTMTGAELRAYVAVARAAGCTTVSANDHLVWKRPWVDGFTALAVVAGSATGMDLATSIALPTIRHPVVVAKAITSLAVLGGARVVAGLGAGSSRADYAAVGVPYAERWERFAEALPLVRALVRGEPPPDSRFYPAEGVHIEPLPATPPEVWFGSWGSDASLQRMAAVSDGWFASAYNTTPERYAEARARLDRHLDAAGRDPAAFPDAVATMWLYVSEDRSAASRIVHDVVAPLIGRDPAELGSRVMIGPADHAVELLDRYAEAGAREVLLWPVLDPIEQLEIVARDVLPHVGGRADHAAGEGGDPRG